MSHIFISYSHEDTRQAEALHRALEGADYKVWRDTCIRRNWRDEIIDALNHASAVVVLVSSNSVSRPYVKREVAYALDHEIPLFLLAINGFTYDRKKNTADDWFEFHIESEQLIGSTEEVLSLLREENIPHSPKVYQTSQPTREYSVGDFYDEDGVQGVVVDTSDDGRHGKIISLREEPEIFWADTAHCWSIECEVERSVGAYSSQDGNTNTEKFFSAFSEEFITKRLPVLSSCSKMQREGWYIPAVGELTTLFSHYKVEHLNETLRLHKANELRAENVAYWSSTESSTDKGRLRICELDKKGKIVSRSEKNKCGGCATIRYIRRF